MKATLTADLRAAKEAREFVASQLTDRTLPGSVALDSVLIVVGELVTNAIQADASSVEVKLRTTRRRLDIVVTDDAAGWPTPRIASDHDVNGRGLTIVDRLSDKWSVAPRRVGKSVTVSWFVRRDRSRDG